MVTMWFWRRHVQRRKQAEAELSAYYAKELRPLKTPIVVVGAGVILAEDGTRQARKAAGRFGLLTLGKGIRLLRDRGILPKKSAEEAIADIPHSSSPEGR